uniref:Helicase ATP-binding domain-containing protein n=1 Tax=viral metagenome TaxID=1070528 RepID=A0A6C0M1E9_9ZZZZ
MTDNYIDLKINGRLFPVWVLHNFKKYKLPPIIHATDEDPCNAPRKPNTNELRDYQKFLASYLDYRSPYRNILVYHGLGSGKTVTAINIYNLLYNYSPLWNVFVLIKASLKDDPWLKDLQRWVPKQDNADRMNNIQFIHYDAPNADKVFLEKLKTADANKKNMYIIDEAHNFIKNVYNNIVSGYGRRAFTIYDYIVNEKKENDYTRVILLSGTPTVNTPYELALIFNLLRPDTFPKNESQFNDIYISTKGGKMVLNPDNKNMFQRRILGLVSYYIGADPQLFASKHIIKKYLPMSSYQERIYSYFEKIEEQLEKKRIMTSSQQTLYSSYSRQACNFVFPNLGDDLNGENRPRPSKFDLNLGESKLVAEGKAKKLIDIEKKSKKKQSINLYLAEISRYLNAFDSYLGKLHDEDVKLKHTIFDDIETFKNKYKLKFVAFWKDHKKSKLLEAMYASSCKMTAIPFYLLRSKGPVIIYSNYVKMEGLELFKIYLKYFGYGVYGDSNNYSSGTFVEYHGDIDKQIRSKNLKSFNTPENVNGKVIKIIMISAAGSEGINLLNVRQVHILEPYWNEVRIKQLIGRAVRMCSHRMLAMNERKVDIFRYHAVRAQEGSKITTDIRIAELANEKDNLIDTFLQTIREAAVDCELFKSHNMLDGEYECFRFEEKALFDKFIGPAYKDDLYYDQKINNGLNSNNVIKKKVKVFKVKGVMKTIKGYSEVKEYWFNPETRIIYDLELDYPLGKINTNEKYMGNYVVDEQIPIPTLSRV